MTTTPVISFGLNALSIKNDATFALSNDTLQSFASLEDLRNGAIQEPYATFEQDFWLLDGSYKFMPTDNIHVGLMGTTLNYSEATLQITFSTAHNTDQLVLRFAQASDDFPGDILIQFYDASNVLLYSIEDNPINATYTLTHTVTGFKKIIIIFMFANVEKPARFLRLTGIDFDTITQFTGADIKACMVVEEVDPLSAELPINTLDFDVLATDAALSIIDPTGVYAGIQEKMPFDVHEIVDSETIYIGRFYLDEWKNASLNEIHFRCIDALGILDGIDYRGYINSFPTFIELLDDILSGTGITYELDSALSAYDFAGDIPICTCREALQHLAFSARASVSCARDSKIKIWPTTLAADLVSYDYTIGSGDEKITSLELKPLVTGVDYTREQNEQSTDPVATFYSASFAVGTFTVVFDNPMHDIAVSGATLVFPTGSYDGAYCATFTVATPGTVQISGSPMFAVKHPWHIRATLPTNVKQNIIAITNGTMLDESNPDQTQAQFVYDYFQQRYLQKSKLFAPTAEVGKSVLIDSLSNRQLGGVIEKMSLDLAGGFVVDAEITGIIVPL